MSDIEQNGDESIEDLSSADKDVRVHQLETQLSGVVEIVKTLASGQTNLQESLKSLQETLSTANKHEDPEPEDVDPDDVELETLSRKDLLKLIEKNVDKKMQANLNPLKNSIEGVGSKLDEAISSVTVKEFQKENPDLMEWKNEIAGIFKGGRATNVNDAYRLARLDDPDKAAAIDKKYAPAVEKSKDIDAVHVFKGFPPNSGTATTKNTRMTTKQSADAAWEEATAAMPGITQFLNSDSN